MVRMSLRRNVQVQHRSENSQQQHRRKLLGKAVLACIYLTVGIVLALTLFGYHSILHHSTERAIANQSAKERRHQHARQIPDEDKIIDHTTVFMNRPTKPLVIAYAISLIKCGDFQSSAAGLVDAAIVLRHSIHETSSRVGKSHYDYKMYAIVHPQAQTCSQTLEDLGFTILLRSPPVQEFEIQSDHLRKQIHSEWCCGIDEFIKLYAYTLDEPVVVHLDIDFVMHKPMDTLLDVLLFEKDSAIGRAARTVLEVERTQSPDEVVILPDKPQALLTKDWGQAVPGHKPLFQAGFLVARTNPEVMEHVAEIIRTDPFPDAKSGWSGMGYGQYVGAMAMQGVMAFYYDVHAPNDFIELNQCRYNHMGMDTLFRAAPNYFPRYKGRCRNNSTYCEDCQDTSVEQIYNVHYTQCRKPWLCVGEGNEGMKKKPRDRTPLEKMLIPVDNVHVDHCLQLAAIWHGHRTDLESKLYKLTGDGKIEEGRKGGYMKDIFHGHCEQLGSGGYLNITGKPESLKRLVELYGQAMN